VFGSQDPRHVAGRYSGAADLWEQLEEWEPDPISIDFNRRLRQRIESFDRRRTIRRALSLGPAILLFTLMIMFSSSARPTTSGSTESNRLEKDALLQAVEPEAAGMVQTLCDLDMLQTLNSEQSL
jgi:hypothetical protein